MELINLKLNENDFVNKKRKFNLIDDNDNETKSSSNENNNQSKKRKNNVKKKLSL